jgi:hypothetical protein
MDIQESARDLELMKRWVAVGVVLAITVYAVRRKVYA